jgi:Ser/Thr protein kinase RdoA (MazF antagonist)
VTKGALIGAGRTAEVYAWGDSQILKLFRGEIPREAVHREARISRIVADAGLQAPAIGAMIEVAGRLGILYERLSGPSMLDALVRQPWTVARAGRVLARLHATIHACVRPELPSQRDSLIATIRHAPRLDAAAKRRVLAALARLPDGDAVCHGDLHPENVILAPRGPVVIDWMTATHGNPIADVTRTVLMLRVGALPLDISAARRIMLELFRRAFLAVYLAEYRTLRPFPAEQIEPWIPILAAARLNEQIAAEEDRLVRLALTVQAAD